jgi:hypothetical protein
VFDRFQLTESADHWLMTSLYVDVVLRKSLKVRLADPETNKVESH